MKVLILGLPGSGKTTLAKPFADLIGGVHINADEIRAHYNDWDFTIEGRVRQAQRMKHLADGVVMAGKIAVADLFVQQKKLDRHSMQTLLSGWTLLKKVDLKTNRCFNHQVIITTRIRMV